MPHALPAVALADGVSSSPCRVRLGTDLGGVFPDGKPLSQRIVAYWIDASVNTDAKSLDASEILEYRNPSEQPVSTIPFHLYLNAFRPQSTFSTESHQDGTYLLPQRGARFHRH